MKKITGLVIMGMLLVLYLAPKAEARLGVLVSPFSLDLREINRVLDEEFNEEYGTELRLEENGLMYSLALERWVSLNWSNMVEIDRRIDLSFCQIGTSDSYSYTTVSYAPDRLPVTIRYDVDVELGIIAAPIFYTRIYRKLPVGDMSPYLGIGVGTVLTDLMVSRKATLYFFHPDGYLQGTKKESWSQHFTSVPLAGQVLAGIEYRLGRKMTFLLEGRYIISAKAEIRDKDAGIKADVDASGLSYRVGVVIGF